MQNIDSIDRYIQHEELRGNDMFASADVVLTVNFRDRRVYFVKNRWGRKGVKLMPKWLHFFFVKWLTHDSKISVLPTSLHDKEWNQEGWKHLKQIGLVVLVVLSAHDLYTLVVGR